MLQWELVEDTMTSQDSLLYLVSNSQGRLGEECQDRPKVEKKKRAT